MYRGGGCRVLCCMAALPGGFVLGQQLLVERQLVRTEHGFDLGHLPVVDGPSLGIHAVVQGVKVFAGLVEDLVVLGKLAGIQLDPVLHLGHHAASALLRDRAGRISGGRPGSR